MNTRFIVAAIGIGVIGLAAGVLGTKLVTDRKDKATTAKEEKEEKEEMVAYSFTVTDETEKEDYIEALDETTAEYKIENVGEKRWRFDISLKAGEVDHVSQNNLVRCKLYDIINAFPEKPAP